MLETIGFYVEIALLIVIVLYMFSKWNEEYFKTLIGFIAIYVIIISNKLDDIILLLDK